MIMVHNMVISKILLLSLLLFAILIIIFCCCDVCIYFRIDKLEPSIKRTNVTIIIISNSFRVGGTVDTYCEHRQSCYFWPCLLLIQSPELLRK